MTEGTFPKVDGDIFFASEANYQAGNFMQTLAGENLTAGNVVYIKQSDGKAYISDTGTADDIRASGIVLATVTSGNTATVQLSGGYKTTGLTAQSVYYLGAAGAVSTTRSGVRIGVAQSTTLLIIMIEQDDRDAVGTIKPYAKSFTGIPANNFSAFWKECDGSALTDAESPLNTQTLPNLNGATEATKRFLRGAATSGTTGGAATNDFTTSASTDNSMRGDTGPSVSVAKEAHTHTGTANIIPPYYEVVWIIKIK